VSPGARFVATLRPALRQAAAVARALEGRVANRPKPGQESPAKAALTVADSAAQEALLVPLLEAFPDLELEAEEDTPTVARFRGRGPGCAVLDPIDGTLRSYLDGAGPYAVMAGLAVGSRFEAALLALPREGLYLDAVRGHGAWRSEAGAPAVAVRPDRQEPPGRQRRRVWVSHGMPGRVTEALAARGFVVEHACGGAVAVAPLVPGVCAGLRLAPSGRGVSRRGRIGVLIAQEAGCCVAGEPGRPFPDDLDARAPVLRVAADEATLGEVEDALRALPRAERSHHIRV